MKKIGNAQMNDELKDKYALDLFARNSKLAYTLGMVAGGLGGIIENYEQIDAQLRLKELFGRLCAQIDEIYYKGCE